MPARFQLDTRTFLTAAIFQSAGIFLLGILLKSYRLAALFSPEQFMARQSFLTRENYLWYVGMYWALQVIVGLYLASTVRRFPFLHILLLNFLLWGVSIASMLPRADITSESLFFSLLNVFAVSFLSIGLAKLLKLK